MVGCRLGGYHPFDPYGVATEAELQENMKQLKFDFDDEVWERVSEEAKDLIVSMLRHNPKERPSAKRVLMHPWIQKFAPGAEDGDADTNPVASTSKSVITAPLQQQQQKQEPTKKQSVDESVFVDGVGSRHDSGGRQSKHRRSGSGGDRAGELPPQVRTRVAQRVDSNSTTRTKRSLRPSHRPMDYYEPVISSPAAKASSSRAPAATQQSMPSGRRSQSPRARNGFGNPPGNSVSGLVSARAGSGRFRGPPEPAYDDYATYQQYQQPYGSGAGSRVKLDAGVVFPQQRGGVASQIQYGGSLHQHARSRSGYREEFDEDVYEDDDGWGRGGEGTRVPTRSPGMGVGGVQHQQRIWIPDTVPARGGGGGQQELRPSRTCPRNFSLSGVPVGVR